VSTREWVKIKWSKAKKMSSKVCLTFWPDFVCQVCTKMSPITTEDTNLFSLLSSGFAFNQKFSEFFFGKENGILNVLKCANIFFAIWINNHLKLWINSLEGFYKRVLKGSTKNVSWRKVLETRIKLYLHYWNLHHWIFRKVSWNFLLNINGADYQNFSFFYT